MRGNWCSAAGFSSARFAFYLARLVAAVILIGACRDRTRGAVFRLLGSDQTGITFANSIATTDSFNVQTDVYIYNGAGVAIGDIDNDGLPDIFFSGNMVSSRLYLNKGGMHFEDITARAGVSTNRWATGASMVDVNGDGLLDIYVSVSGPGESWRGSRANLLFINNGNRTFREAAAQYGIADTGYTTHAAFLDYDRDGCLDLFLLNNSPRDFSRGVASHPTGMRETTPGSYNELYHNDCPDGKPGKFTNVSAEAGILRDAGYGLGVAISDLNGDGWPDIYVSNDGTPNDVIYMNNGNGTFTNKRDKWVKHASQAGMGVDIADFNDDGRPDIIQVDMMPRDLDRRKRTTGYQTLESMLDTRSRGFRDDYSENSLQLNNGVTTDGDVVFSEIARMAGVYATEWSWSALLADFDNDGYKDLFIGNGYPKAVNDLDYMNAFASARSRHDTRTARKLLKELPPYKTSNFVFRNNGDLSFTDESEAWGVAEPSFSYGAAYADLDNDGRLDLIVSNIDGPAFIYQNVGAKDEAHHYLDVRLRGDSTHAATAGLGAELIATAAGRKQYAYASPYRGFMSSVDDRVHFGLGKASRVDTLEVRWPDGGSQILINVAADRSVVITKQPAATWGSTQRSMQGSIFQRVDFPHGISYVDPKEGRNDYTVQPLLPYSLSSHGPAIAVGDVNGDRLEDVFVGGGSAQPGRLFLQQRDGSFTESRRGQPWEADKAYEDWGALLFDANGDGRLDLYVASGGYQLPPGSSLLQDRLYVNKGAGIFIRDSAALPVMLTSTQCVRAGDFNGDGRPDLFVGGRLSPRNYPYPDRSYILRNDGGRFTDVTNDVAPELAKPHGMVTDAVWTDFNGDGKLDLIVVGEWMGPEFFANDGHALRNVTKSTGLPALRGWWFSLAAGDFDHDGRPDLVAGNLGLNHSYRTGSDTTFGVYASNFTGNGTTEVVLTQKVDAVERPFEGLAWLGREMYQLGVKFPTFGSFATATIQQTFSAAQLQQALHYEVDTFASVYLHNEGSGKFKSIALPLAAQISPARGLVVTDIDGDGNLDIVVAGNIYDVEPVTAPADAGNGLWLRGDGHGHFTPIHPAESGFLAPGNVSGLALVSGNRTRSLIVANTHDSVQTFRIVNKEK